MKRSTVLAMALVALGTSQLSHAAPVTVSFSAVITYSTGGALMPAVGSTIQGTVSFGGLPSSVELPPPSACAATACAGYGFESAPNQFSVNLGAFLINSSLVSVSVSDNDASFMPDGRPVDTVSLGTKVNGPSYLLTLAGAPSSFSGVALSDAIAFLPQWQSGQFTLWSNSPNPALQAKLTELKVTAVPEPATTVLFAIGFGAVAIRRRMSAGLSLKP